MTPDKPSQRAYAWALQPHNVRKLAYERGLRLRKTRGADVWALEHPDGRISDDRPIGEIFDALYGETVTVGGEDFGSAYIWVCQAHGSGHEVFARYRTLIEGKMGASRGELLQIAALRPQRGAPWVRVQADDERLRTAATALLVA